MRIYDQIVEKYYRQWKDADYLLPLEVCRSAYDDTTLSWEVSYEENYYDDEGKWTGGCGYPIAEFTTWREAQDWAHRTAKWAYSR